MKKLTLVTVMTMTLSMLAPPKSKMSKEEVKQSIEKMELQSSVPPSELAELRVALMTLMNDESEEDGELRSILERFQSLEETIGSTNAAAARSVSTTTNAAANPDVQDDNQRSGSNSSSNSLGSLGGISAIQGDDLGAIGGLGNISTVTVTGRTLVSYASAAAAASADSDGLVNSRIDLSSITSDSIDEHPGAYLDTSVNRSQATAASGGNRSQANISQANLSGMTTGSADSRPDLNNARAVLDRSNPAFDDTLDDTRPPLSVSKAAQMASAVNMFDNPNDSSHDSNQGPSMEDVEDEEEEEQEEN